MLCCKDKKIIMTEGDYGISLPLTITGGTISSEDTLKFSIKKCAGDETIIDKKLSNNGENKFELKFTEEETKKLKVGTYTYNIDWFRDGTFMNNIIKKEKFEVEDK